MSPKRLARNAPCPCGSGRKLKHCCMKRSGAQRKIDDLIAGALGRVIVWLHENLDDEMMEAFEGLVVEHFGHERLQGLGLVPEGILELYSGNVDEWLFVHGTYAGPGEISRVRFRDRVLGLGGPLLDATQREYLERLVAAPLGLYEILDLAKGVGMRLRDLADDDAEVLWVREREATKSLRPGMVIGARVVPGEFSVSSGALYPFPYTTELPVVRALRELRDSSELSPAQIRLRSAEEILLGWIGSLLPADFQVFDAGSGEPMVMVNDYYRVRDWGALEEALAAQDDVDGDREQGWNRFESLDEDDSVRRSLVAINLGKKDRLEVFYRTLKSAEEGRPWFEEVVGESVEYVTREISDPMSRMSDLPATAALGPSGPASVGSIGSEGPVIDGSSVPAEVMQKFHERVYHDWADVPIPALGNRSPRQAIETEEGRAEVIRLIRSYERAERSKAPAEKRRPVDYGFLWEQIGLERPE